jgi:hypothetical protein
MLYQENLKIVFNYTKNNLQQIFIKRNNIQSSGYFINMIDPVLVIASVLSKSNNYRTSAASGIHAVERTRSL